MIITKSLILVFMIVYLSLGTIHIHAQETDTSHQDISLSPDLLNLLRAEMLEITGGVQNITLYLATADWKSIQETSTKIRDSYIMEKKLTPAQAEELKRKLPEAFKLLDAEFHQRAEKLGAAAQAHDRELAVFQYSRLVESCTLCHSAYARTRFPGFAPTVQQGHHH